VEKNWAHGCEAKFPAGGRGTFLEVRGKKEESAGEKRGRRSSARGGEGEGCRKS